ncbi:hypothetical protein [Pelobacter seleniigenes]|uniref:hypothetical protein n=1 Tax=Pelobacter seleniigenes TaxID=407188 RepID=UPI0004A764C4|nr:hypothetical protein [Pelobacter seleniigenes]
MSVQSLFGVVGLLLLLAACSGRQTFLIGQEWQRQRCYQLSDALERSRCLEEAGIPYERYREGLNPDRSGDKE